MKRSRWRIILLFIILVCFLGLLYNYFWAKHSATSVKQMLDSDNLDSKNILKKYEYEDSTDIFLTDKDSLVLKSFKKISESGNVYYQRGIASKKESAFSNLNNKLSDEIKFQIQATVNAPSFLIKNQGRTILYGISLDKQVYNLKIDNQKVTDIFEYEKSNKVYYIWYFKNIHLKKDVESININF